VMLFIVLRTIGMLPGALNFFGGVYLLVAAVVVDERGVLRLLFYNDLGVLQGCPLAGLLFALSLDPFLNEFDGRIQAPSLGIVCACADDIGLAFLSIMSVVVIFDIFLRAVLLAHLFLKTLKCTLVPVSPGLPLSFIPSEHGPRFWPRSATFEVMCCWCSLWLEQFILVWRGFQVNNEALFFGAYLGPGAGVLQWASSTAKWLQRMRLTAATDAPPSTAVNLYNSRAVMTLSFLTQLY